ncbi:MAG: PHP domain-containing protein [Candidatus Wallbacteria bacterium]|nr:PHP domain-containing protein [Candidatus Wallbacteria bacterium]
MTASTLCVDFHLHSNLSDGCHSPEALARIAAEAGVQYAALTDHNSVSGVEAFALHFRRFGGVPVTGAELTVLFHSSEIHLLAYGFDPADPSISRLMKSPHEFSDAVSTVHAAGGVIFLAHPFHPFPDPAVLEQALPEMKSFGLDGIEAFYGKYDPAAREMLQSLAVRSGLSISAGSDYHGTGEHGISAPGIVISHPAWRSFRATLACTAPDTQTFEPTHRSAAVSPSVWHWFALRVLLPAALSIVMFISAIFGYIVHHLKKTCWPVKKK